MDLQTQGPSGEVLTFREQTDPRRSLICRLTGYPGLTQRRREITNLKNQVAGEPAGASTPTPQWPRQECGLTPNPVTPNQGCLSPKLPKPTQLQGTPET